MNSARAESSPDHRNSTEGNDDEACQPKQLPDTNRIVRHIMVVGFHHKHGYQVDYCYPPLTPDGPTFTTANRPIILPNCWKTLPLLCLPDGSHNHDSDTIYFTMPDLGEDQEVRRSSDGVRTLFGTACFRQIQVDKLLNRTDDMTRVAVQKSVCVLSTQPLFGLIRSKLEMITHAYFEELDFSKVRILKLTYDNLNTLLSRETVRENGTFLGLSVRHLVSQFGNNMLVLYKAMLLEKKILFYKSPVRDLCSTIMSMCSLFSGLLECGGLNHSTCDLQLSPNLLEALKLELRTPADVDCNRPREGKVFFSPAKEQVIITKDDSDERLTLEMAHPSVDEPRLFKGSEEQNAEQIGLTGEEEANLSSRTAENFVKTGRDSVMEDSMIDDEQAHLLCQLQPEACGFPLQIFTRGSFCLPYLSISYLDLLADTRVRSFVIGATNFLFKQRCEIYDIIVDMEENTIVINDAILKQSLSLTIEDLRFMDYLQKHVLGNPASNAKFSTPDRAFDPINQDISRWLGGDEWIRYHFKIYTLYLLKAAKTSQCLESFNASFVRLWKHNTNNYRIWEASGKAVTLNDLKSRHPFSMPARGINFNDMKLKLSHAMNSNDKGRMVNRTLNGIGKWSIWNNIASAGNLAASTVSQFANATMNAGSGDGQQASVGTLPNNREPSSSSSVQSDITGSCSQEHNR